MKSYRAAGLFADRFARGFEVLAWGLLRIVAALVRSVTPATGAIIGAIAVGGPEFAYSITNTYWGRALFRIDAPNWWWPTGFPIVVGASGGAFTGACVGFAVRGVVRGTRWAGPVDWRIATALILLALGVLPWWFGVNPVLEYEAFNKPRVIKADTGIRRTAGSTQPSPSIGSALLWRGISANREQVQEDFRWNGHIVKVDHPVIRTRNDTSLKVSVVGGSSIAMDLRGYDLPREVRGAAVTFDGGRQEYLALLVGMRDSLRKSNHRALFLIFDPEGSLVYEELLRMEDLGPSKAQLWVEGAQPERQSVCVNVMTPICYSGAHED